MSSSIDQQTIAEGGAEITIAAMNQYAYENIGRSTYRMVRRLMLNPEYRAMIKKKAAELDAAEAASA